MKRSLRSIISSHVFCKCCSAMRHWLIAFSLVIFGGSAALKLLEPLWVWMGILDQALAGALPPLLTYTAGAAEVGVVFLLLRKKVTDELKFQVLMLLAVTLLAFRLLAFGTIFPLDCGCFGPIRTLHSGLGRAFETVSVLFLITLPLGYITLLVDDLARRPECPGLDRGGGEGERILNMPEDSPGPKCFDKHAPSQSP
jgi:hypothetical protein